LTVGVSYQVAGDKTHKLLWRRFDGEDREVPQQSTTLSSLPLPILATAPTTDTRSEDGRQALQDANEHDGLSLRYGGRRVINSLNGKRVAELQHGHAQLLAEAITQHTQVMLPRLEVRDRHEHKVDPVLQDRPVAGGRDADDDHTVQRLVELERGVFLGWRGFHDGESGRGDTVPLGLLLGRGKRRVKKVQHGVLERQAAVLCRFGQLADQRQFDAVEQLG
jgi:hypothetical protein